MYDLAMTISYKSIMKLLYGVSGEHPANAKLTNGYDLFNWVMRMSSAPSFWGRHISGENRLTAEEIEFLYKNYCGIALIFNELTEADVSVRNGVADGRRAVHAAKALGVPTHKEIALFAEIGEDWSVNHNWMISYAYVLQNDGYIPGFIANTDSSKNFNFGRQCSHYVNYMGDIARDSTAYWATEPKLEKEPYKWTPYCPSQLTPGNMDIWRTDGKIKYGEGVTVTKNYIREESNARFIWRYN